MSASSGTYRTLDELVAESESTSGATWTPDTQEQQVAFEFKHVQPPGSLYINREDRLNFHCRSVATNPGMTLAMRFVTLDGVSKSVQVDFPVPGDGVERVSDLQLAEGFLLSLTVSPLDGHTRRGQTWCDVGMVRGAPSSALRNIGLISGYLSSDHNLAWPLCFQEYSTDRAGLLLAVPVANPSVATEWLITVPANRRWRLQSLTAQLTTDATAGNRQPVLAVDDGVNTVTIVPPVANLTASTTTRLIWMPGGPMIAGVTGAQVLPLPQGLELATGWRMQSVTFGGLHPADQWNSIGYSVEEWYEPS